MPSVIGAMPQLVQAWMRSGSTNLVASFRVSATSSGVSTLSDATSMAPTSTVLVFKSFISSGGTWLCRHSSETCWILLRSSAGKVCSYWRQLSQRLLPLDVGLDAVAVADVHRGRAFQAL